jgi:glycyl-tRNA synthetase beta subunit
VLDRFFVAVLVMDENIDLRNNRIAMLQSIQRTLSRTAELTAMVVERKGEEAGDA